ncbi:MAG: MarR family winged helix-turn-helix transcriptional regulator, partial [Deltaproteobacteria bacterium]
TGIVDKLEARGLVERRGSPTDRRIKIVSLTPQGATLRRRLIAQMNEPAGWMRELPTEEQRRLCDVFQEAVAKTAPRKAAGITRRPPLGREA